MSGGNYEKGKRSGGRFVQLHEWVQRSEAWATMKPGPRALYIELLRRYNGGNNGQIYLSHRNAAIALNVGRGAVAGYFRELEERGFLRKTCGHHLGPDGMGRAATYELTEHFCDNKKASMDFKRWKTKSP